MDDGYDVLDGRDMVRRDDPFGPRKIAYPPRLMVDFTSLGVQALQRYARFYGLKVDASYEQADLAALVARHFDGSLEVEEHESIATFIQRLRNGERSSTKRQLDKDRKVAAAADKKRKKSNSRKRQRDASVSAGSTSASANGGSSSAAGGHSTSHSGAASGASNGHAGSANGASSSGGGHHHQSHGNAASSSSSSHHHHHEKASAAAAAASSSASASTATGKGAKRSSGKKKDNENEDNELYCICNLPSYGNMIACDGKKCPNPSQWYHLECVGLADGRHPDTWLCPECDPKGFAAFQSKKKKTKHRSKSPGAK